MRAALLASAVLALAGIVGCGKNIGDPCKTNVDCATTGDRFCDTASPGGYCTVESCDAQTCPTDDSVCIRFFTFLPDRSCAFGELPPQNGCRVDEQCVCRESVDGGCRDGIAFCAPEASERRWCMDRCGGDGDCRPEYTCRKTGTLGAEPVPTPTDPMGRSASFCAPR